MRDVEKYINYKKINYLTIKTEEYFLKFFLRIKIKNNFFNKENQKLIFT